MVRRKKAPRAQAGEQRVALSGAEPGAEPAAHPGPAPDWRGLLAGRTPQEVLNLFISADPLALRTRVADRLQRRAWMLAADRVLLRTIARLARCAPEYRGAPALDEWIELSIDDAVLDLLREDSEAEAEAREPGEVEREAYVALAEPLGLAPESMRRVCIAFNRLEQAVRRAFLIWVVEGRTLAEAATELGQPEELVAQCARRALEAVLVSEDAAVEGFELGEEVTGS